VGTTVEFQSRGTFPPVTDMIGGGPFRLRPGEWTDDTSMALCLASSLVERSSYDPYDQMRCYCRWAEACQLFGAMLCKALAGESKDAILFGSHCLDSFRQPLSEPLHAIASSAYRHKPEAAIEGSGYVVKCLEAALWCFYQTATFREAILQAVNLGQDADTTAAVCGQIAGAYYGESGLPEAWRQCLAQYDLIANLAERLLYPEARA